MVFGMIEPAVHFAGVAFCFGVSPAESTVIAEIRENTHNPTCLSAPRGLGTERPGGKYNCLLLNFPFHSLLCEAPQVHLSPFRSLPPGGHAPPMEPPRPTNPYAPEVADLFGEKVNFAGVVISAMAYGAPSCGPV